MTKTIRQSHMFTVAGCGIRVELPQDVAVETLLPSFGDFRGDPAEGTGALLTLSTTEGAPAPPSDGEILLDVAENDMGVTRLFRLPKSGGYRILLRCSPQGPEHTMLADPCFCRLRAHILWHDPYAGTALSSMLRIAFSQAILLRDGISLHAAAVVWQHRAFLFMGKSGTGKSTHARQWLHAFPGATLLNDDNPIVRLTAHGPVVWGSPWSGKTACYHNAVVPLGGIVRLVQAPENRFVPLADVDALTAILPGCSVIPSDAALARSLYASLSAVVDAVPVGRLLCRPDAGAARVCAAGLGGGERILED